MIGCVNELTAKILAVLCGVLVITSSVLIYFACRLSAMISRQGEERESREKERERTRN